MLPLADPVALYFVLPTEAGVAELGRAFTEEAVVRDERQEHRGLAAIRDWRIATMAKTPFTARPLSAEAQADGIVVTAEVTGAFPGSPVMLDHRFTLRDDRIVLLEIA